MEDGRGEPWIQLSVVTWSVQDTCQHNRQEDHRETSSRSIGDHLPFGLCALRALRARHGRAEGLAAESESAGLFDDRLVDGLRRLVNLNDILDDTGVSSRRQWHGARRTFPRSILASAPMRVSRMRFTIHFSPSSRDRFKRSERSLHGPVSGASSQSRAGTLTRCLSSGECGSRPR